jgi:DNA repair exonuclease SbcCD ATPase subunit
LLLKQLDIQKEISKNHQEEIKFWKEQTDALNIEVKQLRLGEEVYLKEKTEMVKSLDEIEAQLKVAKLEAEENVKLKERLSHVMNDEMVIAKLKQDLNELKDRLQFSENQKSELDFIYQVNFKIIDLSLSLDFIIDNNYINIKKIRKLLANWKRNNKKWEAMQAVKLAI